MDERGLDKELAGVGTTAQTEAIAASQNEKKRKRRKKLRALLRLIVKLTLISLGSYLLLRYVFGIYVAHNNDMYPAVRDGDLLITYRLSDYLSGNIVAYTVDEKRYIGRIAATSGDVVEITEDGRYLINGLVPYESVFYQTTQDPESSLRYPYVVPEGQVFILSDFRDNMNDSRSFGAVPIENLDGSLALLLRRRGW